MAEAKAGLDTMTATSTAVVGGTEASIDATEADKAAGAPAHKPDTKRARRHAVSVVESAPEEPTSRSTRKRAGGGPKA